MYYFYETSPTAKYSLTSPTMPMYNDTTLSSTTTFVEIPTISHGCRTEIPQTLFRAEIHKHEQEVTSVVNDYFLKHWPFENDRARKKFIAAGFSRVTCYYLPLALDDRIALACRLIVLLFLIDGTLSPILSHEIAQSWKLTYRVIVDQLEFMSLEEGSTYNENLIDIARGTKRVNYDVPVEWITYDLWNDMRACDAELADEMKEPVFTFMRAQVDTKRLKVKTLGKYLEYREKDVGQG